jgi:hypothetical protein
MHSYRFNKLMHAINPSVLEMVWLSHPPTGGLYLAANGSRRYGLVGLLLGTATSNSFRHFRVMAWRRRANQVRRPARPDSRNGKRGWCHFGSYLVPSPVQAEPRPDGTPSRKDTYQDEWCLSAASHSRCPASGTCQPLTQPCWAEPPSY